MTTVKRGEKMQRLGDNRRESRNRTGKEEKVR